MPRDSQGNTQPLPGTIVSAGDTVLPSQHNPMVNDVYAMITQSLSRDGQGGMRQNLDMSGFRVLNVANATQPTDAVNLGQIALSDPLGVPKPYLGATAPSGYIFCFGQAISRTTYASLFAVLGVVWGAGNGTTTFNVPDFRGRVLAGKDDMGGTSANRLTGMAGGVNGDNLAAVGGEQAQTLSTLQMPNHDHTGATGIIPDHVHAGDGANFLVTAVSGTDIGSGPLESGSRATTAPAGAHQHFIQAEGGGQAHNNVQPTAIVNYILRTGA